MQTRNSLNRKKRKSIHKITKNEVFLKGKNVILKILTENDIDKSNWYGWFNDEETMNIRKAMVRC